MWFDPQTLLAHQPPTAVSEVPAVWEMTTQQKTAKPQESQRILLSRGNLQTAEPQEPQGLNADPDSYCWPHTAAMNTQEIHAFSQRMEVFMWKGVAQLDAEMLADELVFRDRDGDDRKLCMECCYLQGGVGPWRCGNAHASRITAGGTADMDLPTGLAQQLQRCPGFHPITFLRVEQPI